MHFNVVQLLNSVHWQLHPPAGQKNTSLATSGHWYKLHAIDSSFSSKLNKTGVVRWVEASIPVHVMHN
jgi:hypothetical protein